MSDVFIDSPGMLTGLFGCCSFTGVKSLLSTDYVLLRLRVYFVECLI